MVEFVAMFSGEKNNSRTTRVCMGISLRFRAQSTIYEFEGVQVKPRLKREREDNSVAVKAGHYELVTELKRWQILTGIRPCEVVATPAPQSEFTNA